MHKKLKCLMLTLCIVPVPFCSNDKKLAVQASYEMQNIGFALRAFDLIYPSRTFESNILTGDVLYRSLVMEPQKTKTSVGSLLPRKTQWDTVQKVVDPWGTDYRATRVFVTNGNGEINCEYRVYSCGPNRRFELGAKDDLFYSTEK